MTVSTTALAYAVRLPIIGRYLGQLALMLAVLALAPLAVSLITGEHAFSLRYAVVIGGLLLGALLSRRLPEAPQIQANEAIVIVSLAFIATPLIMAFPLAASGLPLEDVLFEAVSAITTTGLSTLGSIEGASPTFLFARAWMQWYGGLGIAVLSVALLMSHLVAARRLAESGDSGNIASTARTQARHVLVVYLAITLIGTLALWVVLGEPFTALVHMLSTVSTGGFSTFDTSLAALPRTGAWVVTLFALLGATPLLLYFHAACGRRSEIVRDLEIRALLVAVLLVSGLLSLSLYHHMAMEWDHALQHGVLLGTAAQTTSGFSTLAVGELDATSQLLLIISMLIGGGTGSTAGGIKLLRVLIFLRLLQYFVSRTAMPSHAVTEPRLGGRPLAPLEVDRVALLLGLFVGMLAVSWLIFLMHGYEPLAALFETASALGTVGLSSGISGPELEGPLKMLLCFDMLLGRLEIVALLVLLYPRTWIGKRA